MLSVTAASLDAWGRTARTRSPAWASRPRWIKMSYSRPGRATVSVFIANPPYSVSTTLARVSKNASSPKVFILKSMA